MRLRPSRTLAAGITLAHLAAFAAAVVALPGAAAAVVAAGVTLSAIGHLRTALHRAPQAVAGLELTADGRVAVAGPSGDWLSARLRSAAVPVPWLAVVTLRDALGQRRAAVILPDALDREAFRRLRVRLRWATAAGPRGGFDE
ncbi:MAG: protein YgfX [Burkholderiales bacterium]